MPKEPATLPINTIVTWLTIITLLAGGVAFFDSLHKGYVSIENFDKKHKHLVSREYLENRLLELEVKYLRTLESHGITLHDDGSSD